MCHGCSESADEPYSCTDADTGGGILPSTPNPDRVPFVIRPPETCTAVSYDDEGVLMTCSREPHEDGEHQQYNAAGFPCIYWRTVALHG